jgi:AcrR family transcriptional regulator
MTNSCKDQRICARRDQIIAASRLCFRKHGFHGAGMAEIAKMSQLSVGQIYRYFVNKDAIIEEIVRRIVVKKIMLITDNAHDFKRMAKNLAYRALCASETSEDINPEQDEIDHDLMLEVAAEATRNESVAQILRDAEFRLFKQAQKILAKFYPTMPEAQLTARVELIAVLCEGTSQRRLANQHAQPSLLNHIINQCLAQMFPDYHPDNTTEDS